MKKKTFVISLLSCGLIMASCSTNEEPKKVESSEIMEMLKQYSTPIKNLKFEKLADHERDFVFYYKDKVVGEKNGVKFPDKFFVDLKTVNGILEWEQIRIFDGDKTKDVLKDKVQTNYIFEDGAYRENDKTTLENITTISKLIDDITLLENLNDTKDFYKWEKLEHDDGTFEYTGINSTEVLAHAFVQKSHKINYQFNKNKQLSSMRVELETENTHTFENGQSDMINNKEVSFDKEIVDEKLIVNIKFEN